MTTTATPKLGAKAQEPLPQELLDIRNAASMAYVEAWRLHYRLGALRAVHQLLHQSGAVRAAIKEIDDFEDTLPQVDRGDLAVLLDLIVDNLESPIENMRHHTQTVREHINSVTPAPL